MEAPDPNLTPSACPSRADGVLRHGIDAIREGARIRLDALVRRCSDAPARGETHPVTVLGLCDAVEELETEARALRDTVAALLRDAGAPRD